MKTMNTIVGLVENTYEWERARIVHELSRGCGKIILPLLFIELGPIKKIMRAWEKMMIAFNIYLNHFLTSE